MAVWYVISKKQVPVGKTLNSKSEERTIMQKRINCLCDVHGILFKPICECITIVPSDRR